MVETFEHPTLLKENQIGGLINRLDDERLAKKSQAHHRSPIAGKKATKQRPEQGSYDRAETVAGDPTAPHAVIVDRQNHVTHLFEKDKSSGDVKEIFATPDATGKHLNWTPTGRYTIVERHWHPSYTPTEHSSKHKKPVTVPPGPDNPLGPAKVRLADSHGNWTNIEMHGTNDYSSVGNYASHGCIRHHNSAIAGMYPFLRTGTPVYITDGFNPRQVLKNSDFR